MGCCCFCQVFFCSIHCLCFLISSLLHLCLSYWILSQNDRLHMLNWCLSCCNRVPLSPSFNTEFYFPVTYLSRYGLSCSCDSDILNTWLLSPGPGWLPQLPPSQLHPTQRERGKEEESTCSFPLSIWPGSGTHPFWSYPTGPDLVTWSHLVASETWK